MMDLLTAMKLMEIYLGNLRELTMEMRKGSLMVKR
jgi:hypothetical protein